MKYCVELLANGGVVKISRHWVISYKTVRSESPAKLWVNVRELRKLIAHFRVGYMQWGIETEICIHDSFFEDDTNGAAVPPLLVVVGFGAVSPQITEVYPNLSEWDYLCAGIVHELSHMSDARNSPEVYADFRVSSEILAGINERNWMFRRNRGEICAFIGACI